MVIRAIDPRDEMSKTHREDSNRLEDLEHRLEKITTSFETKLRRQKEEILAEFQIMLDVHIHALMRKLDNSRGNDHGRAVRLNSPPLNVARKQANEFDHEDHKEVAEVIHLAAEKTSIHQTTEVIDKMPESINIGVLCSTNDFAEFEEDIVPTETASKMLGKLQAKELGAMDRAENLKKDKTTENQLFTVELAPPCGVPEGKADLVLFSLVMDNCGINSVSRVEISNVEATFARMVIGQHGVSNTSLTNEKSIIEQPERPLPPPEPPPPCRHTSCQSHLKDETLSSLLGQCFKKKFESLKNMDLVLKEMVDNFLEMALDMLESGANCVSELEKKDGMVFKSKNIMSKDVIEEEPEEDPEEYIDEEPEEDPEEYIDEDLEKELGDEINEKFDVREHGSENGVSEVIVNGDCSFKQHEHVGNSGKRRHHSWTKGKYSKKMEKESGARIYIRGKDSGEPYLVEDLHVLVEANDQKALDIVVEIQT